MTKIKNRSRVFSVTSLILAAAPLAIFLVALVFCFLVSVIVPGADSVIWWLIIAIIPILFPVAIVASIVSVVFGVIGLKGNRSVFGWAGIAVVLLDILVALLILVFLLT